MIEGPRVMDIVLDGINITLGASEPVFPAAMAGSSNWEVIENLVTPTFARRTYYDLSGYQISDLSTFIQRVEVQEGFAPHGNCPFHLVDIVSTAYIDNDTLTAAYPYDALPGDMPGFNDSTFDMMQIVYGSIRTFSASTTQADATQNVMLFGRGTWGTCSSTAGDKLYITRVVYPSNGGQTNSVAFIPPSNFVSAIIVAKEPDLPYIMRLKRSYEYLDNN